MNLLRIFIYKHRDSPGETDGPSLPDLNLLSVTRETNFSTWRNIPFIMDIFRKVD